MKPKKSKKANLENKRFSFFQIGTIITLSCILIAFEWGTSKSEIVIPDIITENDFIPDVVLSGIEKPKPKPQPEPQKPNIAIKLEIDDSYLDDLIDFPDYGAEPGMGISLIEPPEEIPEPKPIGLLENKMGSR